MLTINRLAGVAPEVNLGECTSHTPPPRMNKAIHSGFEFQRCHQKSKMGISGPIKGHVSTKQFIKKEKDRTWLVKFESFENFLLCAWVNFPPNFLVAYTSMNDSKFCAVAGFQVPV